MAGHPPSDWGCSKLDEVARAVVIEVQDVYGTYSARALEDMTHQDKPWVDARAGLDPSSHSRQEIPKENIRDHYRSFLADG